MQLTMDQTNLGECPNDDKMPGHWLLARLGKRVLRPGGMQLTHALLDALSIAAEDEVVEFAPGLGATARLTLQRNPKRYTALERDQEAAEATRKYLNDLQHRCVVASADRTGLPQQCATVVYGEAMLTMQSLQQKRDIVAEAARLLRPGGRYGIHEIAMHPNDIGDGIRNALRKDLATAIRHNVAPLTCNEWVRLLESHGLQPIAQVVAPMHLLEPRRLIQDEGLGRALRFAWNVVRKPEARQRVNAMRRVFRKHENHMTAIMLVCRKPL